MGWTFAAGRLKMRASFKRDIGSAHIAGGTVQVIRLNPAACLALGARRRGIGLLSPTLLFVAYIVAGSVLGASINRWLPYGEANEPVRTYLLAAMLGCCTYAFLMADILRIPAATLNHMLWRHPAGGLVAAFAAFALIVGAIWAGAHMLCAMDGMGADETCADRAPKALGGIVLAGLGSGWLLTCIGMLLHRRASSSLLGGRPFGVISAVRGNRNALWLARSRPRSLALAATAVLLAGLYVALLLPLSRFFDGIVTRQRIAQFIHPDLAEPIIGLLVGSVLLIAFGGLIYWAMANLYPDARTVLGPDVAPVVFLRPFSSRHARRLEKWTELAIEHRGPFIAIGEPGEWVPRIGALRTYATDDTWRATVSDMIARAETIVIVAGSSAVVAWELGEIKRLGRRGADPDHRSAGCRAELVGNRVRPLRPVRASGDALGWDGLEADRGDDLTCG